MSSLHIESVHHFTVNDIGLCSDIDITFSTPPGRQRYLIEFINNDLLISVSAVVYCQAHNNGFKAWLQI